MKKLLPLLAALLVVPLLGSGSLKLIDDRVEMSTIEGSWQRVSDRWTENVQGGVKADVWTFRAGRFDVGKQFNDRIYRVDSSHRPDYLDLAAKVEQTGETIPWCAGLYEIDCDTLRIALNRAGDGRPKTFGEANHHFTLKRLEK